MKHKKESKYFIDKEGNIYKTTQKEHLLLISLNKKNIDRRVFPYEQEQLCLKEISFLKASTIVNSQFNETSSEWEFNNEKYKVLSCNENASNYFISCGKKYEFERTIRLYDGKLYNERYIFYLCQYRGKLYWVQLGQYFPRVCLYKFNSIDVCPSYNDFVLWTHAKHCKIIYHLSNDKWEKM